MTLGYLREYRTYFHFYSGKKKKHTLKSQVVVDKKSQQIICTAFANGKRHDFRLFKESKTQIHPAIGVVTDTGFRDSKRFILYQTQQITSHLSRVKAPKIGDRKRHCIALILCCL